MSRVRPASVVRGVKSGWWIVRAGAAGTVLALAGCAAADDSAAPPDAGTTALPTATDSAATSVGTLRWRTEVSVEPTVSHRISQRQLRDAPTLQLAGLCPDGQPPGTSLDAEMADGDRLVVRARTAPRPTHDDAPLWLIDAASGAVVWQSAAPTTPRWVDLRLAC